MALVKKYKLYLVLVGMMIGEAVVLMLLLPGSRETVKADDGRPAGAASPKDPALMEVSLGSFKVNNTADPAVPLRIECSVYATVDKSHEQEFMETLKTKEFRVKESIVTVLRRASYDSVQEATLSTLKRQIRESAADVLGPEKSLLVDIVVPDFIGREI